MIRHAIATLFLTACAAAPASETTLRAYDVMEACGVTCDDTPSKPTCDQPAVNECEATCYINASCVEITGRLLYPQPGEKDGTKIYSWLDVCLSNCR